MINSSHTASTIYHDDINESSLTWSVQDRKMFEFDLDDECLKSLYGDRSGDAQISSDYELSLFTEALDAEDFNANPSILACTTSTTNGEDNGNGANMSSFPFDCFKDNNSQPAGYTAPSFEVTNPHVISPRVTIPHTVSSSTIETNEREAFATDYPENFFEEDYESGFQNRNRYMDNIVPIPVPSDVRNVNDESIHSKLSLDFNIDPIPLSDVEENSSTPPEGDVSATSDKGKGNCYVDHSYIDFSRVIDDNVNEASCVMGEKLEAILKFGGAIHKSHVGIIDQANSPNAMKTKTRNISNFPKKLMSVLDKNPDPSIISWLPHGRAFIVKDSKRFMSEINPSHFNSKQFKTFQRMLNMWGFKRLNGKRDQGAYYHQMFLKGMPNLVRKMKLNKRKNGKRPLPNPSHEPNFYQLSQLRPL